MLQLPLELRLYILQILKMDRLHKFKLRIQDFENAHGHDVVRMMNGRWGRREWIKEYSPGRRFVRTMCGDDYLDASEWVTTLRDEDNRAEWTQYSDNLYIGNGHVFHIDD